MSSPRGLANHYLYLARLVLAAWAREREAQVVPAATLEQAFGPACHSHLRRAYGCFLLAIAGAEEVPGAIPARVSELPPQPPGKAVAGELREFERLEGEGWLAELLAWSPELPGRAPRASGNLAHPAAGAGCEAFEGWAGALDRAFQRMGDSLDEY